MNLIDKYPELFGKPPFDPKETLICFGLEVPRSWIPELEKGLEKISKEVKKTNLKDYRIIQIKEKFGSLSIYDKNGNKKIKEIIKEIKKDCAGICEICGSKNAKIVQIRGYFQNLCNRCKKEKQMAVIEEKINEAKIRAEEKDFFEELSKLLGKEIKEIEFSSKEELKEKIYQSTYFC